MPRQNPSNIPPRNGAESPNAVCGILGYEVSARGLKGDAEFAFKHAQAGDSLCVVDCINPHSIVVAKEDEAFRHALRSADLLLPDGIGVVLASRLSSRMIQERVAGAEFFLEISRLANESGSMGYFFLGSTPDVTSAIQKKLAIDFPKIAFRGSLSPPFKDVFTPEDNREMIDAIHLAKPDVLWVGMTAPKQEKWIEEHRQALRVPLVCAIGAVFDFYSGKKRRAPEWVRRIGLEWLPRFIREPRRLWRRNVISTPIFIKDVLVQYLTKTHPKQGA